MPLTTKFYLIRHAEVEPAYQKVFGGVIDMALSDKGHEQARKLAEFVRGLTIHATYASPMKRVQMTMAPLNGHLKPTVTRDLCEMDVGDWTGLKWLEVEERYHCSVYDWLKLIDAGQVPNAENGPQLRDRVGRVVAEILQKHPGQHVAVFCHGGVIRIILSILLDLPLSKTGIFDVDYASFTEVAYSQKRGGEIQLLNYKHWEMS